MGTNGLEPSTSRLSGVRSNHLSYAPVFCCSDHLAHAYQAVHCSNNCNHLSFPPVLVEIKGIEPLTPCLQSRCSPSWAKPPFFTSAFKIEQSTSNQPSDCRDTVYVFLRKEVIQPHLPIRLPCYDLTPIIDPTFDDVLLAVRLSASGVANSHGLTGGVYKARERIHRSMLICDY